MHYLGGMSGSGVLTCDGAEIARATYDFDGFFHKTAGVTGSGEIRLSAPALRSVFGRERVQLFTERRPPPRSQVLREDAAFGK
jgi:hypothetical protein